MELGFRISAFRNPLTSKNYPNFGTRITIHGSGGSRSLDKGGGRSLPQIFAALGASVWPKNKGGAGAPDPSPGSATARDEVLLLIDRDKRSEHYTFLGTAYLPLPNINTYFPLRAKCWLRGGVGGQFPRNVY